MAILKRYKCIKSDDKRRFAVGEIYPLYNTGEKNYIVANNNVAWNEDEFPILEKYYGVRFRVTYEKETSTFKNYGKVRFSMDELPDEKEKSLDLNKLKVYQLKEYVDLQQALELAKKELTLKLAKKEIAEYKLNEFIEGMSE
ncbi:hypothetical protein [Enterococcus phage BUCT630]